MPRFSYIQPVQRYSLNKLPKAANPVIDTTAPDLPTNVLLTPLSSSSIRVAWANPTNADYSAMLLYLSSSATSGFVQEATINTPVNTFDITGLNADTTYYVRFQSRDVNGNVSNFSTTYNAKTNATVVNPPGNLVTTIFQEDNTNFRKPESGITYIHRSHSSNDAATGIANQPRPAPTSYSSTTSVVHIIWVLQDFLRQDISQSYLDRMEADLANIRAGGCKAEIIVAYWFNGPVVPGGSGQSIVAKNAGLTNPDETRIKRHMDAEAVIFNRNKDVVLSVNLQTGAWGEGNQANFNLHYDTSNPDPAVKRLYEYFRSKLDPDIYIGLRYPPAAQTMFGSPVTEAEAYDPTILKAGLYLFDHYLASEYPNTYNRAQTLYTYQNAEAVPGGWNSGNMGGTQAISYLADGHFATSQPIGDPHLSSWGGTNGTVYQEILRRLGARYRLNNSRVPSSVSRTGTFTFVLNLTNRGFGNFITKKIPELVLIHTGTGAKTTLPLDVVTTNTRFRNDLRINFPNPGITKDVILTLSIPGFLATGNYDVYLKIRDKADNLKDNEKYCVRLASLRNGNTIYSTTHMANFIGTTVIT